MLTGTNSPYPTTGGHLKIAAVSQLDKDCLQAVTPYNLFFSPHEGPVHTVGKQVVLLKRTEWVCTSKARLS